MAIQPSQLAAELALNLSYQRRVKFFMQKAASNIIGEGNPTKNRNDYAVKVLAGEASVFEMAIATFTNASLLTSMNPSLDDQGILDNDLEFTVNSLWDDFGAQLGDVV